MRSRGKGDRRQGDEPVGAGGAGGPRATRSTPFTSSAARPRRSGRGSRGVGPEQPPRVIVRIAGASHAAAALKELSSPRPQGNSGRGTARPGRHRPDGRRPSRRFRAAPGAAGFLVLELDPGSGPRTSSGPRHGRGRPSFSFRRFGGGDAAALAEWAALARRTGHFIAVDATPAAIAGLAGALKASATTASSSLLGVPPPGADHPVGAYRRIAEALRLAGISAPIWIATRPKRPCRVTTASFPG